MHTTIPAALLAAIRDQRIREQAKTIGLAPNHWETGLLPASSGASADLFSQWLDGIERLGYKALPAAALRWMSPPCQPYRIARSQALGVIWASPQPPPQWSRAGARGV